MDRDRFTDREAADAAPRPDDSLFPTPTPAGTWVAGASGRPPAERERGRDAAGDVLEPADQDILVRSDTADTMPSRALNDPRELTPDQMTRLSTDTTSTRQDVAAPAGPMDAPTAPAFAAGTDREVNMAGRPLPRPTDAAPGAGRRETDVLTRIREGMRVVDVAGEELGKVDYVSMGDPEAVTTEGQELDTVADRGGIVGGFGRALTDAAGEPDVPEPLRSQLVRTGFVKVDGKGWFDTDRYLSPDMIAGVRGDEVHLTVTRDRIAKSG